MSWAGRALVWAAKTVVAPALEEVGRHLGHATGRVLGRKVDPTYEPPSTDEKDETSK